MMGALLYGIARVISWLKHRFVSAKTPLSSTDT
jgi:hypothetical protein